MRTAPARGTAALATALTAALIAASATVLTACGTSPHSASTARAAAPPPAAAGSASSPVDAAAAAPATGARSTAGVPAASPAPAGADSTAPAGADSTTRTAGGRNSQRPGPAAPASGASAPGQARATRQAPEALPPACTLSALRVQALRGGASMGVEYALLMFTNDAATVCRVSGYPTVGLRAAGSAVGSSHPAQTSGSGSVTLRSGASAQVQVRVPTNCPAARSDHVRVSVPASDGFVEVPLQVRGCTAQVGAFEPAA